MLLVTDRLSEGRRLQQVVSSVEPCALVTLDRPASPRSDHAIILCDVALDRPAAVAAVQALLARHRTSPALPVLQIGRGEGEAALAQARAIQATAVLPKGAPDAQVLFTVRRLIETARNAAARGARPAAVPAEVREAGAAFGEIFAAAQRGAPVAVEALERGAGAVITAVGGERIGVWLDVVRAFDDVTYQHCLLVAGLAASFSARLGVTLKGQRSIVQAALVHDIGKARIPLDVLNKPGRLSPEETALMRTHAGVGHDMLVRQGGFDPQLLDIVRHHHEMLDGTGYPDGLQGDAIPAAVRLVTICDIYAALVERRAYKAPSTPRDALAILDGMGGKLDRGLLRSFAAMVGEG